MRRVWLGLVLLLAGCSAPLTPDKFAGSGNFDPVVFFTGHVTSWGVEENRAGQPVGIVTTDCVGTPRGPHSITMVQTLHVDGSTQTRTWQLTQTGPGAFTATANDMVGSTVGTADGRAMHWRWVLETSPGDALKNVTMDQWFYQMGDGAVMIRTVVTKAGVRLVEVSEQFEKAS
ncbi:MAG TPA: DUF3833 family protein [Acidocella sp.]|nr:DUF3833 family protein [Acidocella sp.]